MRNKFPRDLFWTAAVPLLFAFLALAIGSTLFRLWILGGFPLLTLGASLLAAVIVATVLLWRRYRRSNHT
jgi:hypothetical protein